MIQLLLPSLFAILLAAASAEGITEGLNAVPITGITSHMIADLFCSLLLAACLFPPPIITSIGRR